MSPSTCRWGILATGWISNKFVLDLLVHPSTRDVSDVAHVVGAVASRSEESAASFIERTWKEAGVTEGKDVVKKYGSYQQLYDDPVRSLFSFLSLFLLAGPSND